MFDSGLFSSWATPESMVPSATSREERVMAFWRSSSSDRVRLIASVSEPTSTSSEVWSRRPASPVATRPRLVSMVRSGRTTLRVTSTPATMASAMAARMV